MKRLFLKAEMTGFINGLDVGCKRKRRVKNDQVLLSQTAISMVFPYSEILEKLGGNKFFLRGG